MKSIYPWHRVCVCLQEAQSDYTSNAQLVTSHWLGHAGKGLFIFHQHHHIMAASSSQSESFLRLEEVVDSTSRWCGPRGFPFPGPSTPLMQALASPYLKPLSSSTKREGPEEAPDGAGLICSCPRSPEASTYRQSCYFPFFSARLC